MNKISIRIIFGIIAGFAALFAISYLLKQNLLISFFVSVLIVYFIVAKPIKEINNAEDEIFDARSRESNSKKVLMLEKEKRILFEEAKRFRQTLSNINEPILIINSGAKIIFLNDAAKKLFGIKFNGINNDKDKSLFEITRNPEIANIIVSTIESQEQKTKEISFLAGGQTKIFFVNALPVYDEEEGKYFGVITFYDVTDQKKAESIRREFTSNVTHELKTPLTSIVGYADTLLEGAVNDPQNNIKFLKKIKDGSERLSRLIENLLEISKIESGAEYLHKKSCDPKELVAEAVEAVRYKLDVKGIKEEIILSQRSDLMKCDREKIVSVLINFLDNAVKFNKEGGFVKVKVSDAGEEIMFEVTDSGTGISQQDIPRVFERFYMANKSRSKELGGTGLGLAIAKHLIEMHKGKIGVESKEGEGSRFWFSIPKA